MIERIVAVLVMMLFYFFSTMHSEKQWQIKDLVIKSKATGSEKKTIKRAIWDSEHELFRGKMGMRIMFHLFFIYTGFTFLSFTWEVGYFLGWTLLLGTAMHDHLINLWHGLSFFRMDVADNEADMDLFWNKIKVIRFIIIIVAIPIYFILF